MRDLALRSCSVATRGLWMDLLCLMWDGSPRGYLRVQGRPLVERDIARLTGVPAKVVRAAMAELDANEVASRAEDGALYSRRMVRDAAVAAARAAGGEAGAEHGQKGAQHGVKGGRPPQQKPPYKPPSVASEGGISKPPPASASASAPASLPPHTHPEGVCKEGAGGLGGYPNAECAEAAFKVFLDKYPKSGVPSEFVAQHAWSEALPQLPVLGDLLAALERQKRSDQWQRGVVPRIDRWLRERMWTGKLGEANAETGRYRVLGE